MTPDEAAPPLILAVARLAPEDRYKGIDTLLRAFRHVLERAEARLVVIGDGPDRFRLEQLARELELLPAVQFAGAVSDEELFDAYAQADIFALPSRTRLVPRPEGEGFGLVFIEAGAAGLPVVAGRGGGTDEAVADGESGMLVDPNNERAVADAILRLIKDPALARRLGDEGRRRAAELFSYGRFRRDVDQLIRSVVRAIDRSS